jgi:glycosyltransferase involved in cell wall biosynthesis
MALASRGIRRFGGRSCNSNGRLYLNIGHTGLDSDGFRTWVRRSGVRPVYFVHDLIPLTHPDYCREGEAQTHARRMETVLASGSGIIGNSQATLDDLQRFAEAEGFAVPPTIAAWLGCTPLKVPEAARSNEGPATFVALGTIEGRKNHLLLLDVWSRLIAKMAKKAPRLVIIGQRGWKAERAFEILDRDEDLRRHVVEVSDCSDRELAAHLANARALLFPSHAEGFGLPLVEALALGVPVIASDLPVFREIGQGVPTIIGSNDPEAWEAAILDYARPESAARAAQLGRLRQFRPFDWASHFRLVERWLETLDEAQAERSSTEPAL